jgi:hypothetical protein
MKLIIDISKEVYNGIKIGMRNRDDMREIGEAVENGIPLDDVLNKIRAEIEQIADEEQKHDKKWAIGLRYAVKVIDKYKAESEDKG